MTLMTPDSPRFAVLPDEEDKCPGCEGSLKCPCICDYFADPDDDFPDEY